MSTHLSEHALGALREAARRPTPSQGWNPGVVGKLIRLGFIDVEHLPSPFPSHKPGRKVSCMVVTPAGRLYLEGMSK